jgi:hypothetical protein
MKNHAPARPEKALPRARGLSVLSGGGASPRGRWFTVDYEDQQWHGPGFPRARGFTGARQAASVAVAGPTCVWVHLHIPPAFRQGPRLPHARVGSPMKPILETGTRSASPRARGFTGGLHHRGRRFPGSPTRAWIHRANRRPMVPSARLSHVRVGLPYTNPAFAGTIKALPRARGFTECGFPSEDSTNCVPENFCDGSTQRIGRTAFLNIQDTAGGLRTALPPEPEVNRGEIDDVADGEAADRG